MTRVGVFSASSSRKSFSSALLHGFSVLRCETGFFPAGRWLRGLRLASVLAAAAFCFEPERPLRNTADAFFADIFPPLELPAPDPFFVLPADADFFAITSSSASKPQSKQQGAKFHDRLHHPLD
jgi:hypothetical protein